MVIDMGVKTSDNSEGKKKRFKKEMFKASGFNTKAETGCVSIPIPTFIQKIITVACKGEQVSGSH